MAVVVKSLSYSHDMTTESRKFVPGLRKVFHVEGFHCVLDAENLTAFPVENTDDLDVALAQLQPFLDAWSLRSELLLNERLAFRWGGATTIDENTGAQAVGIQAAVVGATALAATPVVTSSRLALPEGPPLSELDEANRLLNRWRDVVEGRERLLVGGYWVLSELVRYFGSRNDISNVLNVSDPLISTLGRLTARNDPHHGRKAKGPEEPLSEAEVSWVQAAVPKLILRVAEVESGVEVDQMTKHDLPHLGQ